MATTPARKKTDNPKAARADKPAIEPAVEQRDFNEETTKVLRESKAGKNLLGPYATTEEMFEDFGV
jgi:hypothetical protein